MFGRPVAQEITRRFAKRGIHANDIDSLRYLPISQLDGGHVLYALFRRKSHLLVQYFISLAILYVVVNLDEAILWTPMLLLVIFLGIHQPAHPVVLKDELVFLHHLFPGRRFRLRKSVDRKSVV